MTYEIKELLSTADGGPVGPPDIEAIQQRARRLTLVRAGAVAAAAGLLIVAVIGVAGGFDQPRLPLVGEGPELPPTEPTLPDAVDVPETGPPIWRTELDTPAFADFGSGQQLASGGQRLFVASGHTEDAAIVALELTTGEQAWRTDLDGSASVHTATDELLIVSSQPGRVLALDVATGERIWEHALPDGYQASAATADDRILYLVAGAGAEGDTSPPQVSALDLDDGTLRWATTLTTATDPQWSPPTIVDDLLLVAATPANPEVDAGNRVHALQLADGTEAWTTDLGGRQGFTSSATAVTDGVLHIRVAGVGVVTLDIEQGDISHTIEDAILIGAGPSGPLYVAGLGEPTVVRAIDPRTGETLDQQPAWQLEHDWAQVEVHTSAAVLLLPSTTTLLAIDTNSGTPAWRHTHHTTAYEILVLDDLLIAANQDAQIVATPLPDR